MFQVPTKIVRWTSIPVLLVASLFSRSAGRYQLPLDLAVWISAIFLVQRAVKSGEYCWAAGLGVVVIAFSPLLIVDKIFLFLDYTAIVTFLAVAAAFRPQALAVEL